MTLQSLNTEFQFIMYSLLSLFHLSVLPGFAHGPIILGKIIIFYPT